MKSNIFKTIKPFITKNEPTILMGMGLSGLIFSTIWGIKATVKAVHILDEKKEDEHKENLEIKEIIKLTWKLYIPVVVSTAISIPCIVLGNTVSSKRNAALAAAYTLSETALQEYQDKTKEIIGEKKEQEIHEAVSKDSIKKVSNPNIILTGDGDSLFYEPLSGRYFKSNWNKILRSANELNASAINGMSGVITLTDWFEEIGLDKTDISDFIGWSIIDYGGKGIIDISIDSSLTPENIPCGSIYYNSRPYSLK